MKDDAIRAVPERVREQVRRALAALTRWNQAVMDVRKAEEVGGDHGRHEYDLRHGVSGTTHRHHLHQALTMLATVETLAQHNAVDPEAVYVSLGGKPALLGEGAHVADWRPRPHG